jgi:hypothetical protein
MLERNFWRRWSVGLGVIGVMASALSGCGGSGGVIGAPNPGPNPTPSPGDADFSTRAACTANPTTGTRPRWTVLVFINAANNLQPDSLTNLAQMASVGSDNNVNIVVQWKQENCADCGTPTFEGTRRYLVRKRRCSRFGQEIRRFWIRIGCRIRPRILTALQIWATGAC